MTVPEEQTISKLDKTPENGESQRSANGEKSASALEGAKGSGEPVGTPMIEPVPELESAGDCEKDLLRAIVKGKPSQDLERAIERYALALSALEKADQKQINLVLELFRARDILEAVQVKEIYVPGEIGEKIFHLDKQLNERLREIAQDKELVKELVGIRKLLYKKSQPLPWWNLMSRREIEKLNRWDWLWNWLAWMCLGFSAVIIFQDVGVSIVNRKTDPINLEEMLGKALQGGALAGGIQALLLGASSKKKQEGEESKKQEGEANKENLEEIRNKAGLISQQANTKIEEIFDSWNIPRYWQAEVKLLLALTVLGMTWGTTQLLPWWGYWVHYKIRGESFLENREYKSAESALKKALDFKENDPEILLALGKTYVGLKKPEEALKNYEAASQQREDAKTMNARALMTIMSRRWQSEEWTGRAKETDSKTVDFFLSKALEYLEKELKTKAKKAGVKEVAELPPAEQELPLQAQIHTNLGISSWEQVNFQEVKGGADEQVLDQALNDFKTGAIFELQAQKMAQKGRGVTGEELSVTEEELENTKKSGRALCYYRLAQLLNLAFLKRIAGEELQKADDAVGDACYDQSRITLEALSIYDASLIDSVRRIPGLPKNPTVPTPAATPAAAKSDASPPPATPAPAQSDASPPPASSQSQ